MFEVMADGTLVNVDNVADNTVRRIFTPSDVTAAEVGGTTYLFVTGFNDHGLSVFSVAADGHLTDVVSVSDDATLQLQGASSVATAQVGGITYLFVAANFDQGVSVFRVEADGTLVNTENVSDDTTLELQGSNNVATAQVGGITYLFASGGADDGVSVFRVEPDGILVNVHNVGDDALLALDGAGAMTTAVIGATTYLFVVSRQDWAIAVFEVAADGALTHVTNINDPAAELDGALGVTTAMVGGTRYLFATGNTDNGVSAFSLTDGASAFAIISDGGGDLATVSMDENTTAVTTVVAFDPGNSGPSYSISGGIDAALFQIDFVSGALSFVTAPDFEAPTGAGRNNTYVVEVRASAGNEADHQTITIDVTDIVEQNPLLPPIITSDGGGDAASVSVDENTTAVTTVTAIDPGNIGGLSYSITGGADAAQFQIDASTGVLSFIVAPDFEAPADDGHDNAYEVEVRASAGNQTDEQTITVDVTNVAEVGPRGPGVSPGDTGLGDVLWRHSDGTAATADNDLGPVSNLWQIAEAGDFDRDHDSDIVWRHRDGAVVAWEMEGGAYAVNHNLPNVAHTWDIAGTGDFDRDGDSDILWQHRDGQVVTWEMERGDYVRNHYLPNVAGTWQVAGTGDFDRDGDADILWHHRDGAVVIWEMEHGEFVVNHNLPHAGGLWEIAGTGDFDADGDADILWRHRDGAVVSWEMERAAYLAHHDLPSVAASWHVSGTHDFDRDGDTDILWRHDEGQVVTWEMQAGGFVVNHNFATVATDWQIARTGEFGSP